MNHATLVARLDHLVEETYALWDAGWVGFNWRGYTFDHVQRVRGLALSLARRSAGDLRVTELAALLHDITKAYDGEYQVGPDGKRVVDAQGYWMCQMRPPQRDNLVTQLYLELGLQGQVHSESGATLAEHLLTSWGVSSELTKRVTQTIRDHLNPEPDAPVESHCLFDADTIDANIGLPAFVRNIYINLHYYDQRKAANSLPIDALLRQAPLDFLRPYVSEKLPSWSEGKQRDFVPKLGLECSRELAICRLQRLSETWARLAAELDEFDYQREHGCLAVLLHFMTHQDDPSIAAETRYLIEDWIASNGVTPPARLLMEHLSREAAGEE
jgi:putative nucleotidyltransferase with HDIG domain